MATGSVIKGSSLLIVGRAVGMVCGFLLFMLLTRRSTEIVGAFRVSITFLTITEFLPLLGMHRWLAAEIGREVEQQYAIFAMACRFALGVAILCGAVYLGVANSGAYGPELSACLKIVAATAIASAINLCVLSALVGLGYSHHAGLLSLAETVVRSGLAILLVILGADLFAILLVFMGARYATAAVGFALVHAHIRDTWPPVGRGLFQSFLSRVPNLALSLIGFLVLRNAGILLLPLFQGDAEAGLYAAAFQLFDLVLMVPTVLTISTNYMFVRSSERSVSALRHRTNQLVGITALLVAPAAVIGGVLARPVIEILFGTGFDASVLPFRLLLLASIVVSFDQILALSMVVSARYEADRQCMLLGALVTVAATCLMSGRWGATGATAAFLLGATCTLALRLQLMRWIIRAPPLVEAAWRPAAAAAVAGVAVWAALRWVDVGGRFPFALGLLLAAFGGIVYCIALYWGGGFTRKRLREVQTFMARRG
jgi:O-antigen/teichoic acid export membrane protein